MGVLGAGICHKISTLNEEPMQFYPSILYGYGCYGFIIPIIWAILALSIWCREDASDTIKALVFWIGVLVLVVLAFLVVIIDGRGIFLS